MTKFYVTQAPYVSCDLSKTVLNVTRKIIVSEEDPKVSNILNT
jgi:hypothetical protein